MRKMKIVLKENPNDEGGFQVFSCKDGSDITEHLMVKDIAIFASGQQLTTVKMCVYADVEVETGPENVEIAPVSDD